MTTSGGGGTTTMGEILLRVVGPGGPSDAPGGAVDPSNLQQSADVRTEKSKGVKVRYKSLEALQGIDKKSSGYVRNTLGINIGIAAILKQSQIFTGTLGTIFQILGALVDVILAPFMPLIVKGIQMIANNIPEIQAKAIEIVKNIIKIVDWLGRIFSWFSGILPGAIGDKLKGALQYVLIGLFLTKLLGAWGIMTGIMKVGWALTAKLLTRIIYGQQMQIAQGSGGGMMPGAMGRPFGGPQKGLGQGIGRAKGYGGMAALAGAGLAMSGIATQDKSSTIWGTTMMGAGIGSAVGGLPGAAVGTAIGLAAGTVISAFMGKKADEQEMQSNSRHFSRGYNADGDTPGTATTGAMRQLLLRQE